MAKIAVLAILMPTDISSLNAGKAMAQASHATLDLKNQIDMIYFDEKHPKRDDYIELWDSWTEGLNFGKTKVFGFPYENINEIINCFFKDVELSKQKRLGVIAEKIMIWGWVNDPSYPLRDGSKTHSIDFNTCAYVLCYEEDFKYINNWSLHP